MVPFRVARRLKIPLGPATPSMGSLSLDGFRRLAAGSVVTVGMASKLESLSGDRTMELGGDDVCKNKCKHSLNWKDVFVKVGQNIFSYELSDLDSLAYSEQKASSKSYQQFHFSFFSKQA